MKKPTVPKLIAKTFAVTESNELLVVRRSLQDPHRPGTWDLLGGLRKRHEAPADAALREAAEEASIDLEGIVALGSVTTLVEKRVRRLRIATHLFAARVTKRQVEEITLSREHDAFAVVTFPEFGQLDIPTKYQEAARRLEPVLPSMSLGGAPAQFSVPKLLY